MALRSIYYSTAGSLPANRPIGEARHEAILEGKPDLSLFESERVIYGERQKVGGCAGVNRHVAGDARALQERRERLHPDPESCRHRREARPEV